MTVGEPDYERGLLIVFAAVVAAIFLVAFVWPERWMPFCMWRKLTGIPCPTCGLIRSLRLLAAGRVHAAWLQQPLVTTATGLLAAASLYAAVVALFNGPRLRLERVSRTAKRVALALLAALVLANWIYLISAAPR